MKEQKHFKSAGWFVFDFLDPQPLMEARAALEQELERLLGFACRLEEYHCEAQEDKRHTEIQIHMTQFFREKRFGPRIIAAQLSFFQHMLGPDLAVQSAPYLRMTRPFKPQDNIGYHRDTFYGGSPYELSVLIPFVDLPAESSLGVLSGSHLHAESLYPTEQINNPDESVKKGSPKHQLGFMYAPKMMDSSIENQIQKIPLKLGQALVFSLSTVHGSVVNAGPVTRWSTDIRVMHAFAPVDLHMRPTYYEPLSQSVVTEAVKQYEKNNTANR